MSLENLEEKIANTNEKITKIKNTINKTLSQKEKYIIKLNKLMEENDLNIIYEDVKNQKNWYLAYRDSTIYSEICDIMYSIEDKEESIKNNIKKLAQLEESLKKLKEKYNSEKAKLQYINGEIPQVIKDFLNNWKNTIIKKFYELKDTYYIDKKELLNILNEASYKFI